jgi:hypothetical protein
MAYREFQQDIIAHHDHGTHHLWAPPTHADERQDAGNNDVGFHQRAGSGHRRALSADVGGELAEVPTTLVPAVGTTGTGAGDEVVEDLDEVIEEIVAPGLGL